MRVKKPQKPVEVTCKECGVKFIAYSRKALRCPECRRNAIREQNKSYQRQLQQSIKEVKKITTKKTYRPPMTINEVVNEMEKYNKVHGTCLSYGQFVLILEGYK